MTSFAQFAAASWWNLFVAILLIALPGGILIRIAESVGKGFSKTFNAWVRLEELRHKEREQARIDGIRAELESKRSR